MRSAQDHPDPGDDLGQRERLGDVVVTANGETGQLVFERGRVR